MTKQKETKAKAFVMYDGAKAIDTAIKSVATRGKKIDADIHKIAVSCLVHADKHGDVTLAQKLVQAMPKSGRANALKDWFLAFGKFTYDSTSKSLAYDKKAVTLTEEAISMPFWEFKPEPEYVPFDINARIARLVKDAEKASAKGEKVPAETLKALSALVVQ